MNPAAAEGGNAGNLWWTRSGGQRAVDDNGYAASNASKGKPLLTEREASESLREFVADSAALRERRRRQDTQKASASASSCQQTTGIGAALPPAADGKVADTSAARRRPEQPAAASTAQAASRCNDPPTPAAMLATAGRTQRSGVDAGAGRDAPPPQSSGLAMLEKLKRGGDQHDKYLWSQTLYGPSLATFPLMIIMLECCVLALVSWGARVSVIAGGASQYRCMFLREREVATCG